MFLRFFIRFEVARFNNNSALKLATGSEVTLTHSIPNRKKEFRRNVFAISFNFICKPSFIFGISESAHDFRMIEKESFAFPTTPSSVRKYINTDEAGWFAKKGKTNVDRFLVCTGN